MRFESVGLGGATGAGRGARGVAQRSAPLRSRSVASCKFGRCEIAQRTMRPGVVIIPPYVQHGSGLGDRGKIVEQLSRRRALKLSMKAFWVGLPGAM